ncbi:DUF748 domain-containing protein [Vibrio sp. HN007]|uniref:DUF748 domain-containing protein n=1 Tax=Vibrio iocasae TaxID=3098914 RepID=UPI0035D430C8
MKTMLTAALARFKSTHKAIRVTTYLTVTYLTYALIVGLILPAVIVAKAPEKLTEFLGRDTTVTEVRINPFLLRVEINQFSIAESDSDKAEDFFSFQQIKTELNFWESLLNLTPTLEYFFLTAPEINLARLSREGDIARFNFSDIPQHIASQQTQDVDTVEPSVEEQGDTEIFGFKAHKIQLQSGKVAFQDEITGALLGYSNIAISLDNLDTRAFVFQIPDGEKYASAQIRSEANAYSFSLAGNDGSSLDINGQFQLNKLEVSGDVQLSNLQLSPFWPLTEKLIEAELSSGDIDLSSRYHLLQQDEQLLFKSQDGQFALNNLTFNHNQEPKVKLANLTLKDIAVSTANNNVDIDALTLEGLWANSVLTDKGIDLQNYFVPNAQTEENTTDQPDNQTSRTDSEQQSSAASEDKQWLVTLDRFDMQQTDINVQESMLSNGVFWRIYPLNFSTGPIVSDLSQPIEYQLALDISSAYQKQPEGSKGSYTSSGIFDAKELALKSKMQLTKLQLKQFQHYLDPHLNILINKGNVSVGGDIEADATGKLVYQGQGSVDQLLIKDKVQNDPLVQWKKMSIDSINFSTVKNALKINTILFDELYSKIVITKDQRTNVDELTKSESEPEQPENAEAKSSSKAEVSDGSASQQAGSPAVSLDIAQVKFKNGSAFFADYSLTPNFASGIELLNGSVKNISSNPKTRAAVDIEGKIDKYAPVALKGEVNPLTQPPYLDLKFSVDSAELTSVNTYSGTYAGYFIDKGQLSIDVNYKLENNILEGKNHVVVDQLTLGKKSDSDQATSLPVTLAVGLLKDSDGVIDLGFGVSGDVNSPDFSFGGAIAKVFVNIITKAVTAPFSLLADLVGSDEDLDFVDFEAGVAVLDSAGKERLSKLAEALTTRPNLTISVEGSVLAAEDARVLAENSLHSKLQKASGLEQLPENLSASRVSETPELTKALEQLFRDELKADLQQEREKMAAQLAEENPSEEAVAPELIEEALHISIYNQLISSQNITDNDLGILAQSRAKAVKTYLVEQEMDPGRVFILDSKANLKTEQRQALMTIDAE